MSYADLCQLEIKWHCMFLFKIIWILEIGKSSSRNNILFKILSIILSFSNLTSPF